MLVSLAVALTIPLLLAAEPPQLLRVELVKVRSDLAEWPVERLSLETQASLERTARRAAVTVVSPDEEPDAPEVVVPDVALTGRLARSKAGAVRFSWSLSTVGCPPLTEQAAWDFKSPRLTPAVLDTMTAQLTERARTLTSKAASQRKLACTTFTGSTHASATPKPPPKSPPPQQPGITWQPPATPGYMPAGVRVLVGPGGSVRGSGNVPASNY